MVVCGCTIFVLRYFMSILVLNCLGGEGSACFAWFVLLVSLGCCSTPPPHGAIGLFAL